jgi:cellulose synthase/poly-beta-1,6-N-acetylglucosamine synthase-like glycosyltransferase
LTISFALFLLAAAFLTYVLAYGAVFLGLAFAARKAPRPKPLDSDVIAEDVTILVPSHFEGAALADAARTLMGQDHPGRIEIVVLLHTKKDPSDAALVDAFGSPRAPGAEPRVHVLHDDDKRRLCVVETGVQGKREKLNKWLPRVSTPFVAFLDADHRADVEWIRSALATLAETKAAGVQGRRRPLSASALTQIWDSAQNHIGSEVVNAYRMRADLPVFFTGTTAVFRASALAGRSFAECLTEDTYLTMDLILEGHRLVYDERAGSYEEVAPTLRTYIARRRRWSAGHDKTFVAHLRKILAWRTPGKNKRHLLLIGQFYLVPLGVMGFLYAQAVYFFLQFTVDLRAFVMVLAAVLALPLVVLVSRGRGTWLNDFVVSWVLLFPQAAIAGALAYKLMGREDYYYILTFPYAKPIGIVQIIAFTIPWLTILVGWFRIRVLRPWQVLVAIVTFPLSVFFDIFSSLLGFSDFLRGRTTWTRIARGQEVSTTGVPEKVSRHLKTARRRAERWGRYAAVAGVAASLFLANDLLARNECGKIIPFLWYPAIWTWSSPITARVDARGRASSNGMTRLEITTTFTLEQRGRVHLGYFLDGKPFAQRDLEETGEGTDVVTTEVPTGWDTHQIAVDVRAVAHSCRCADAVPSRALELQKTAFIVNREPFLLKCIIPSFNTPKLALDTSVGFAQLKQSGANAARYYHMPTADTLSAAARNEMLLVDQPDESTWENVDLRESWDKKMYLQRYERLLQKTAASPYILIDNLGNELELRRKTQETFTAIADTARAITQRGRRFPLGYSTYLTYNDYPVDVLGINMLDSSATYWTGALDLLQAMHRPFYASEIGGFVAFTERTPQSLRIWRLGQYWDRILSAGAFGACVYESHDNWAQPVPGLAQNDPFSPDQPDDVRGLWDEQNHRKLDLRFVERMFSDVSIAWAPDSSLEDASVRTMIVTNRRPYALHDLELVAEGASPFHVGDLDPAAVRQVKVPMAVLGGAGPSNRSVRAKYTTHAGLHEESAAWTAFPVDAARPVVLDDDFIEDHETADALQGRLMFSDRVSVWLPATWQDATFRGKPIPGSGAVRSIPVGGPKVSVTDARVSFNEAPFVSFGAGYAHIPSGKVRLRFHVPRPPGPDAYLIFAGVEAGTVRLTLPGGAVRSYPTHGYREAFVPLPDGAAEGDYELSFERLDEPYVASRLTFDHRQIEVDLEVPYVFAPVAIELRR